MIILDTNVLSEVLRPRPHPAVVAWLQVQARSELFTTSITHGEMLYGVNVLPSGRSKAGLEDAVRAIFTQDMAGHVLAYDGTAADAFAMLAAARRRRGLPISQSDAMIAGVALSRGAALATRNLPDFENCGIVLVNPWQHDP